jgi:hypothetical protein
MELRARRKLMLLVRFVDRPFAVAAFRLREIV